MNVFSQLTVKVIFCTHHLSSQHNDESLREQRQKFDLSQYTAIKQIRCAHAHVQCRFLAREGSNLHFTIMVVVVAAALVS